MTYYAYPIGAELVAFGMWCVFMAMCWGVFKLLIWAAPKIAAVWQSRGTVAEVPEDFDRHVDDALQVAEENPLLEDEHCYHHTCDTDYDACAAGDCADEDDCVHCECCCSCLACEYGPQKVPDPEATHHDDKFSVRFWYLGAPDGGEAS